MANLYKRGGSKFWWVKFKGRDGSIHRESTGMRYAIPAETRKAQEIRANKALEEFKAAPSDGAQWDNWVRTYLLSRYERSALTLERYMTSWRTLEVFLKECEIKTPAQLLREHCFKYLEWRGQRHEGVRPARRNTALLEVKILSLICREAVHRGYIPFNPCVNLGIKKAAPKLKPELTETDLELVEETIRSEPEPLRTLLLNSWLIARWQGCRITETLFDPQDDVDIARNKDGFESWTIRFRAKGGRDHIAPVAPKLMPLLRSLRESGARETYSLEAARRTALSSVWQRFLRRTGLSERIPGITFHCLRVTAATRMARANVPEAKAMRLLGHASSTVHRVYQRLRHDDLDDCFSAMEGRPPAPQ